MKYNKIKSEDKVWLVFLVILAIAWAVVTKISLGRVGMEITMWFGAIACIASALFTLIIPGLLRDLRRRKG